MEIKVSLALACVFLLAVTPRVIAEEDQKSEEISTKRTLRAISLRSVQNSYEKYDRNCYPDYPIKDGLFCYPRCKADYSNYGQGPVCWAKCPPATTNIGISCQKDTYGRGFGKPLSSCKSNMEKNWLLCYPKCRRGYYGVGPVCWKSCRSGYTDDGLFCRKPLHIYWRDVSSCPWYNKCGFFGSTCGGRCRNGYVNDGCTCRKPLHVYIKKSYGRGAGVPLSCASDEEQSGALCYSPCKSGYYGVGPVCWSRCSGETTDTGAHCLKKNYGRGVGKPLNCFYLSQANLLRADITKITSFMKSTVHQVLTGGTCHALWDVSEDTINFVRALKPCKSTWNTLVFSISGRGSALLSVGIEIGIAVDFDQNKVICYEQACTGFNLDASVGIAVNYGWFRSLDDIHGRVRVVFVAAEIPFTEIGVSLASVINSDDEYIGTLSTVGLGKGLSPLPFDVGGATCNTPRDKIIDFAL